jgi:peptide/nickel transport system substrate-binding protein
MSLKKIAYIMLALSILLVPLGCATPPAAEATPITIIETVMVAGTPEVVERVITATPAPEPQVVKEGGTFTWGVPEDIPGFNPILNDNYTELYVYGLNAEPLTWGGENYPTELTPILAESWETSADGLVWTIHLRQGVKWHDGTDFTADDVVYWAQAIQTPGLAGAEWESPRFFVNDTPYLFEAVDPYTVKVTTAAPVANLLNLICVPLIPKHYFVDNNVAVLDMPNDPFNTEGNIGTGAFKITQYSRGEAVVLERFEDYWRGRPYLDQVIVRVIPDPQAMIAALKNGEVDWARITAQDVPQVAGDANIALHILDMDSFRALQVNVTKPMLADKRVRQAMMYALDRQAIINTFVLGYGKIPDNPFTFVVNGYEPLPQYAYDTAKAAELLTAVGWEMGADGVLVAKTVEGVAAGTRFSIKLETADRFTTIATLIQSNLKAVGIETTILVGDYATWYGENIGKEDKPYDLYVSGGGWLGSNAAGYSWAYAAGSAAASNMSYFNPEVQALFDQAMQAPTKEEAAGFIKQAAVILWDELPMLPILWEQWIFASTPRVHIEEAGLNPSLFSLFSYPEKIWVEH